MLTRRLGGALMAVMLLLNGSFAAKAEDPITIGFGMALTGGLAPIGKAALFAMQIWEKETNAKGGLLGRQVKLVFYDDQSNPALIPGIYTKLLDVDKVDIVVSGYATNMIAPAMPVVMGHNRTFLTLFGLATNSEFNYPKYFAIQPVGGSKPKEAFARGFFSVAMAAESEACNTCDGGRGRGVSAQRDGWRAHRGEGNGPEDGLRQNLSAGHQRLHADRAGDPGD